MPADEKKQLSQEMQTLVNAALRSRKKKNLTSGAYKKVVHARAKLTEEVGQLRRAASVANEEYAKLWQVTKEFLPEEE